MGRWMVLLLVASTISVAAVLGWAILPAEGSGSSVAVLLPEDGTAEIAGAAMAQSGLLRSPRLFRAYAALVRPGWAPPAGEHWLPSGSSPRDLLRLVARLPNRPAVDVAVPEGWTHLQIARRLQARGVCAGEAFRRAVRDPELLRRLEIQAESAEGYLFPATYELLKNTNASEVLRIMVQEMRERLERIISRHGNGDPQLDALRGFGRHEILVLASLIEKEAAVAAERATIASVFLNRLSDPEFRPKQMLQSDPTAAYGCLIEPARAPSCGEYNGIVTPAMLRDDRNRYNTYRHPGLPPGPIANPGEAAIAAALAPEETDYLYFVAEKGGRHTFSRTYSEHLAAIRRQRSQ